MVRQPNCIACERLRIDSSSTDPVEREELLSLLDGLPLAIVQASSYMLYRKISVKKYIELYEGQWKKLMELEGQAGRPLHDYPERSIWTTWTISYRAIQITSLGAANLLLLWASLDNNDLWFDLLAHAGKRSKDVADSLSEWLSEIASNEIVFLDAIALLCCYSLVDKLQDQTGHITIHPVVHRWAFHMQNEEQRVAFTRLAAAVVGLAAPDHTQKDYAALQRRLLPHAERCWQWIEGRAVDAGPRCKQADASRTVEPDEVMLYAIENLGKFYTNQGKLDKAEKLLQRAFKGYQEEHEEKEHTSILRTLNSLGILYELQGNLGEAEKMNERALKGYEKKLGRKHKYTLAAVNNLGVLYDAQGKLDKAEKCYKRAIKGFKDNISILNTIYNLGVVYVRRGRLDEAEKKFKEALEGYDKEFEQDHILKLKTINMIGGIYEKRGKLNEAEEKYQRALEGYEKVVGEKDTLTLDTIYRLGVVFQKQGRLDEAEKKFEDALKGYEEELGEKDISTLETIYMLGFVYDRQGRLDETKKMWQRVLEGYGEVLGREHSSTIHVTGDLLRVCTNQGKLDEAEKYRQALEGYEKVYSPGGAMWAGVDGGFN